MSILTKLGALLHSSGRESADAATETSAIRIYQKELLDAQTILAQRREAIAAMVATRNDLEGEIQSSQRRIGTIEQRLMHLPEQERNEALMLLAAQDIAATESHLDEARQRHLAVCRVISSEELTLRRLLTKINEHRRGLDAMATQAQRHADGRDLALGQATSDRLVALQETRNCMRSALSAHDHLVADDEVAERASISSVDRKNERAAKVLVRLRTMGATG